MFKDKTMVTALVCRLIFLSHVLNMSFNNPYQDEHVAAIDKGIKGTRRMSKYHFLDTECSSKFFH